MLDDFLYGLVFDCGCFYEIGLYVVFVYCVFECVFVNCCYVMIVIMLYVSMVVMVVKVCCMLSVFDVLLMSR